ncbi:hypothetical protein ACOSQ2_031043 [Xanthoceras sorbifolium]
MRFIHPKLTNVHPGRKYRTLNRGERRGGKKKKRNRERKSREEEENEESAKLASKFQGGSLLTVDVVETTVGVNPGGQVKNPNDS